MKFINLGAAAAFSAAILVAGCAGGGVAKYDPKIPADQQASNYLVSVRPENIKGMKKVFISSFDVMFVTKSGASASAGGGIGQGTVNVHTYYHLKGVDDQRMQAITDKLFAQAKAKLTAAGFEVVDLSADPVFRQMSDSADTVPFEQDGSRVFAPAGMGVWAAPGGVLRANGRKGILGKAGGDSPAQFEAQLMSVNGVDAVHFLCRIDYAKFESRGGFGASEASVSASMALTLTNGAMTLLSHNNVKQARKAFGRAGVDYLTDPKPAVIYLKQPIIADGQFATVKNTTNVGLAMIQGVLGGRKDKTFDVEADAAAYESLTITHAQALMDMLLSIAKS